MGTKLKECKKYAPKYIFYVSTYIGAAVGAVAGYATGEMLVITLSRVLFDTVFQHGPVIALTKAIQFYALHSTENRKDIDETYLKERLRSVVGMTANKGSELFGVYRNIIHAENKHAVISN